MGPLYFRTRRKVQIFGIRNDSLARQYNYLIDEDQSIGKFGLILFHSHTDDIMYVIRRDSSFIGGERSRTNWSASDEPRTFYIDTTEDELQHHSLQR